jgi:hypothetical protein
MIKKEIEGKELKQVLHFQFSFEPRFSEVDKSLFLAPSLRTTSCRETWSKSIVMLTHAVMHGVKVDTCYNFSRNLVPRAFVWGWGERRESPGLGRSRDYPKMAVFDSYSSRSGEIFFNEIYKSSKQINSQKTSQSIYYLCVAVWHESAEISEDPVDVF